MQIFRILLIFDLPPVARNGGQTNSGNMDSVSDNNEKLPAYIATLLASDNKTVSTMTCLQIKE